MNLYIVVIVYLLFSTYEIISLVKEKKRKELIFFCITMSVAFAVSILISLDVKIPNSKKMMGELISAISIR